jgi:polar amino acid transport system substrate-binding protein
VRDLSVQPPDQYIARPLAKRDEDERLLTARLVTSRRPGHWVGAAVLLVLFAMLVHTVVTNGRFQWNVVGDYFVSRSVMDGLVLTLWLTAAVMTCDFVLGIGLAAMRLSTNPILRSLSFGYVWLVRSVPLLVQLLFWYEIASLYPQLSLGIPFGHEFVTVKTAHLFTGILAAFVGLTVDTAAFSAEIVRGGIVSVERGQSEAAEALGLSRGRIFRRIVLPQAINGVDVGLDVDLRSAVAKVLGVTWNVQNGTFATIIPGVQNGKYQVGQDNFGATAAREKIVDFATYLNDGQAFLGASSVSVSSISTITDACGYVIATAPGSTFQTLLTDNASKCAAEGKKPWTVQYFSDSAPNFLGLANGKVDLYFGPTLSLKYDATHIAGTKFLGQISSTPVGFVTGKGSPIAKALSAAVNELITNGDYAKIFAKWGISGDEITSSTLNPATTF